MGTRDRFEEFTAKMQNIDIPETRTIMPKSLFNIKKRKHMKRLQKRQRMTNLETEQFLRDVSVIKGNIDNLKEKVGKMKLRQGVIFTASMIQDSEVEELEGMQDSIYSDCYAIQNQIKELGNESAIRFGSQRKMQWMQKEYLSSQLTAVMNEFRLLQTGYVEKRKRQYEEKWVLSTVKSMPPVSDDIKAKRKAWKFWKKKHRKSSINTSIEEDTLIPTEVKNNGIPASSQHLDTNSEIDRSEKSVHKKQENNIESEVITFAKVEIVKETEGTLDESYDRNMNSVTNSKGSISKGFAKFIPRRKSDRKSSGEFPVSVEAPEITDTARKEPLQRDNSKSKNNALDRTESFKEEMALTQTEEDSVLFVKEGNQSRKGSLKKEGSLSKVFSKLHGKKRKSVVKYFAETSLEETFEMTETSQEVLKEDNTQHKTSENGSEIGSDVQGGKPENSEPDLLNSSSEKEEVFELNGKEPDDSETDMVCELSNVSGTKSQNGAKESKNGSFSKGIKIRLSGRFKLNKKKSESDSEEAESIKAIQEEKSTSVLSQIDLVEENHAMKGQSSPTFNMESENGNFSKENKFRLSGRFLFQKRKSEERHSAEAESCKVIQGEQSPITLSQIVSNGDDQDTLCKTPDTCISNKENENGNFSKGNKFRLSGRFSFRKRKSESDSGETSSQAKGETSSKAIQGEQSTQLTQIDSDRENEDLTIHEEELQSLIESASVDESELEKSKQELEAIKKREERLKKLESNIVEMADLHKEFHSIVQSGGDQMNHIEYYVDTAVSNVEEGREQLLKAEKLNKKTRKRKVLIGLVGGVIVVVIVVVVLVLTL